MKITIINSHASFIESLLRIKFPTAHDIAAYADGQSGLSAIQTDRPDIAIVDLDETGLLPLKELHNKQAGANGRYLFLSEWTTFMYEAQQFGASAFLTKPFTWDKFQQVLETLMASVNREKGKPAALNPA